MMSLSEAALSSSFRMTMRASEACDRSRQCLFVHFLAMGYAIAQPTPPPTTQTFFQTVHLGSLAEGADEVMVMYRLHLHGVQHSGWCMAACTITVTVPFFAVIACYGNRVRSPCSSRRKDDELTCLRVLCDQQELDLEQANALCIVQKSFCTTLNIFYYLLSL